MYQYKKGDSCTACATGRLKRKVITETFNYKGKRLEVPDYTVFSCGSCGEEFVDEKTMKETEKRIRDFQRSVDGLLTSSEIKAIRKRLGKTQEEMGELFRMGKKSFVRYENGQMTQSGPLDILLRLLDRNPSLLKSLTPEILHEVGSDGDSGGAHRLRISA
jgi:HTH-type transcriptional regulator/antitoxin MqsA